MPRLAQTFQLDLGGELATLLLTHNAMKTAYELAMERLAKTGPEPKVTEKQKKQLAELDSVYNAKIAERELFVKGELAKAASQGDYAAQEQLERQLVSDRKSLLVERDEKKDKVRQGGS